MSSIAPAPAPLSPAKARAQVALAIAAAVVALAGVLVYDWPVFYVILLYWFENVVIGFANVARMCVAAVRGGVGGLLGGLFLVPFFCVHYGIFTFVHGMFVFGFFGPKELQPGNPVEMAISMIDLIGRDPWLGLAMLVTVVVVVVDLVRWMRDDKETRDLNALMTAPYGRVIVLHLTLLVGATVMALLHAPAAAAVLLVGLKLGVELWRVGFVNVGPWGSKVPRGRP